MKPSIVVVIGLLAVATVAVVLLLRSGERSRPSAVAHEVSEPAALPTVEPRSLIAPVVAQSSALARSPALAPVRTAGPVPAAGARPFRYAGVPSNEIATAIQADFDAEAVDSSWAPRMEREIGSRLRASSDRMLDGVPAPAPPDDVVVKGPFCKSMMCRMNVESPNDADFKTFVNAEIRPGGRLADLGFASYINTTQDDNGGRTGTIYLIAPEAQ